jgi:hypothetical protein
MRRREFLVTGSTGQDRAPCCLLVVDNSASFGAIV